MQITTKDGKLRLRSAFKLMFVGWAIGTGGFFLLIVLMMILIAALGGPIDIEGETFTGMAAMIQMLPILIVGPFIVLFYAVILSGFGVTGLVIYRMFRPIRVMTTVDGQVFE